MQVKDLCVVLKSSKGHLHAFKVGEMMSVRVEYGKVTVDAVKDGIEMEMTVPVENAEFIDKTEYERRSSAWRYSLS